MAERTFRDRIKPATAIWAEDAAKNSSLPGYGNGPGDAYRHIIWIAETARNSGSGPAWVAGEANEQVGIGNPRDEPTWIATTTMKSRCASHGTQKVEMTLSVSRKRRSSQLCREWKRQKWDRNMAP